MGATGRWLLAIGAGIAVLAVSVYSADTLLPWDTATNIGVGSTAGVVVGAFLAVWAASAIDRATGENRGDAENEGKGAAQHPLDIRQHAGGAAAQIVQSGRNKIKNQTINITTLPSATPSPPPPDEQQPPDAVVPPKA